MSNHHIVNDITQLNPVRVIAIVAPNSVEDVQEALRRTTGPVSIGGGRFSMGGQMASPGSLHFDMRTLNRIALVLVRGAKVIRVQAGVRWCDIQRFVDPHGLSREDHADLRQLHGRRRAQRQRATAATSASGRSCFRCAA